MTLQDAIRIFEAAKAQASEADDLQGDPTKWGVVRGIRAVMEAEREACAKIADEHRRSLTKDGYSSCGAWCLDNKCHQRIAIEIRARNETQPCPHEPSQLEFAK